MVGASLYRLFMRTDLSRFILISLGKMPMINPAADPCHPLVKQAVQLYMRVVYFHSIAKGGRKRRLRLLKARLYRRIERCIQLLMLDGSHD